MQVIKRDGSIVSYDYNKILNAITAASSSVDSTTSKEKLIAVADSVEEILENGNERVGVEEIQDLVELKLMSFGLHEVARQYVKYRQKHSIRRNAGKHLMDTYKDIFFADSKDVDLKRDNANINTDAPMGIMLKLGAEGAKHFVDNYVLPEEYVEADREGYVHYHDKDFSLITFNCCQIDLLKLFKGGFSTGHGFLREPNSIRSYASLACIAIQSNQNDMLGGQSINAFDYAMAEGVRKSFKKAIIHEAKKACMYKGNCPNDFITGNFESLIETQPCSFGNPETIETLTNIFEDRSLAKTIYTQACHEVKEETHQAMEALIHNFNTLHSRAGAQVECLCA